MTQVFTRHPANPILTREHIPALDRSFTDVTSVFNPGAVIFRGSHLLLLRVQSRGRETCLVRATSDDGVRFVVSGEPVRFRGIESHPEKIYHVYDPRITQIDDEFLVMFAADCEAGCRLGVARTTDFEEFDFIGFGGADDIRNGVVFPVKFAGAFLRLDRPNRPVPGGPTSGDEIMLSRSRDLLDWEPGESVLRGRPHYWDELIGAGPPPLLTSAGWLLVYHGIATHFASSNIYQAGVVLLDRDNPAVVLARSRNNVLEPRERYETVGQVPNVVFPSGMIVDAGPGEVAGDEAEVKLYYGAADTCVGLATATVGGLLGACE